MTFEAAKLPLQDRSLTQQVQETLESMLVGGTLRPDTRTSIRELAEQLGVSTMPVRDAVSRLVAQGALAIERNRAVVVPRLSIEDFRDLTETRVLIECQAVRKATARMTPDLLAELTAINETFAAAMADPFKGNPVQLNQQLHFKVYDAAGSPTMLRIIATNWLRAGPMIHLDIGLPIRAKRNTISLAAHRAMLEGLAEGDAEKAAEALRSDIEVTAESIIRNTLTGEDGDGSGT